MYSNIFSCIDNGYFKSNMRFLDVLFKHFLIRTFDFFIYEGDVIFHNDINLLKQCFPNSRGHRPTSTGYAVNMVTRVI